MKLNIDFNSKSMKNTLSYLTYPLKSFTHVFNKTSIYGKILIFLVFFLILVIIFKKLNKSKGGSNKNNGYLYEGFQDSDEFIFKHESAPHVYDDFYAEIYDYLVFNNLKDNYEVGEIINKTTPTSESIILDIGSGTGHHVAKLADKGHKVTGLDMSPSMVKKAKENYPKYDFIEGDASNADQFRAVSFTHILCLYFTIYYIKDKTPFFENCFKWLMPGGYLVVHLVDREQFDPMLPSGSPRLVLRPQNYAPNRMTKTNVKFNKFDYTSEFDLDKGNNKGTFSEKFLFKDDEGKQTKVRKQEHSLYMEDTQHILSNAQNAGFIIQGKVDLSHIKYDYQYLYILVKPQ
jgi:SAM-dependent methyltransferase